MNKRLYVDFHIFADRPAQLHQPGHTGSPKTAVYGGVLRARVSVAGMEACHARSLCGEYSAGRGQAH